MFKLANTKQINSLSPSFILKKNTTNKFNGFKLSKKILSVLDFTNPYISTNYNLPTFFEDSLLSENIDYTYLINSNSCIIPQIDNYNYQILNFPENGFRRLNNFVIPEIGIHPLYSFLIDYLNELLNLSHTKGLAPENLSKKIKTESILIRLNLSYKSPPTLNFSFEIKDIYLKDTLEGLKKYPEVIKTYRNIPFILNDFTYRIIDSKSKNKDIYLQISLSFVHALDFYGDFDIYLHKVSTLESISSKSDSSKTISTQNTNSLSIKSKKYEDLGLYFVSLNSLKPQVFSKYIENNNVDTYFFLQEPPDITQRTTFKTELEKALQIKTVYPFYREKLTFIQDKDRKEHTVKEEEFLSDTDLNQTANNTNKIQFPITSIKTIDDLIEEKKELDKTNKIKSQPFHFEYQPAENKTITTGSSVKPQNLKYIESMDMCFDASGETKSITVEEYSQGSIFKQTTRTYGLVYYTTDIYNITFGDSPEDSFTPKVELKPLIDRNATFYWKQIKEENTTFIYSTYGYLTKIIYSGWKLGRFIEGSAVDDIIRQAELSFLGEDNLSIEEQAELEILNWKLTLYNFKKIPINGYTDYYLHPIDSVFLDKEYLEDQFIIYYDTQKKIKVPIKNLSYTSSYFASYTKTFISSIMRMSNYVIDNSQAESEDDQFIMDLFKIPIISVGEEFIEETEIKVIKNKAINWTASVNSGFPLQGYNNENTPQYTKYERKIVAQDSGFVNANTQENYSYEEGIPPEHTRLPNNYILVYDNPIDPEKPKSKWVKHFYHSSEIEKPTNKAIKKNENFSEDTLLVNSQSQVKPLLNYQLKESKLANTGNITFRYPYTEQIKEGDIINIFLQTQKIKGIVLSISYEYTPFLNFTNEYNYPRLKGFMVITASYNTPEVEMDVFKYTIYLDKSEEENSEYNNDIYFIAEPIYMYGFGEKDNLVSFASRGEPNV